MQMFEFSWSLISPLIRLVSRGKEVCGIFMREGRKVKGVGWCYCCDAFSVIVAVVFVRGSFNFVSRC